MGTVLTVDTTNKRLVYTDGNEATDYLLTSDASGNASWQAPLKSTGGQIEGQIIIDTDNTEALLVRADGDGGDVFAVNTDTPGIVYTNGNQAAGRVLTSDAFGAADWTDPVTIPGIYQGQIIIDTDDAEAFLVRQDGDPAGGDVFSVNTLTERIGVGYTNLFLSKSDTFNNGTNQRLLLDSISADTDLTTGLEIYNSLHAVGTANSAVSILSLGRNAASANAADIRFDYVGDGSTSNTLKFGFNTISTDQFNIRADGTTNVTGNLTVSGRALLGDGTEALPAIDFSLDPGNGLYRIGSNNYGFSVDGTNILSLANDNVNFTSTNFTVTDTANDTNIRVYGTSTSGANTSRMNIRTAANNRGGRLLFDNNASSNIQSSIGRHYQGGGTIGAFTYLATTTGENLNVDYRNQSFTKLTILDTGLIGIGDGLTTPLARVHIAEDTSGTPSAAGIALKVGAQTFEDTATAASGTATEMAFNTINQPTLNAANTSVTTTDAYSLYLAGEPLEGTNQTITNSYALYVESGLTGFANTLSVDIANNRLIYTDGNQAADFVLTSDASGTATWQTNEKAVNDLSDVTITSVADNEVFAYNSGTSQWINQTADEAGIVDFTTKQTITANKIFRTNSGGTPATGGRTIIAKGASAVNEGSFPYALSVQNTTDNYAYIEILSSTSGADEGAFFGIQNGEFELWNYEGGDIVFYTSPSASAGTVRMRISNAGAITFNTLGTGTVRAASGLLSASSLNYGSMSITNDSTNLTLNATPSTFTKINKFDTAGASSGVTVDVVTDDDITINAGGAGDYYIAYSLSLENVDIPANEVIQASIFIAGTENASSRSRISFPTATSSSRLLVASHVIATLAVGNTVDVRIRTATTASANIRTQEGTLSLHKVS